MKYLFDKLEEVKGSLNGSEIMLFLDYDGTIVPIAQTPDEAICPKETKDLLYNLSQKKGYSISIVSGRTVENLKTMINLKGITLVGNHGIEIYGYDEYNSLNKIKLKEAHKAISQAANELSPLKKSIKDILVENKEYSLCVHYRLIPSKDVMKLKGTLFSIFQKYTVSGLLSIIEGKEVLELRPIGLATKGTAVLWLYNFNKSKKDKKIIPIYIGDDKTDEDGFNAIKKIGITVFIGSAKDKSSASYYLKDSFENIKFLNFLSSYTQTP